MSEEEMKAIKYLEEERAYAHKFDDRKTISIITIALKLIRKQQKEIEELQQEKEKAQTYKTYYEEITQGKVVSAHLKRKYISKDKVRAKIEKLKKMYDESKGLQGDVNILYHIGYLKELLEEE